MKGWHRIKPNKRCFIPQYLVFLDTESNQMLDNKLGLVIHSLKLGYAKFVRLRDMKPTEVKELSFRSKEEFWQWLSSLGRKKSCIYVFSHNQHFDFNILDGFNMLKSYGFKITKFVIESDIFVVKARSKEKSLVFLDTTNFFKTPLETIGEFLGLPKLKVDFENCTMEELETYCRRDVEIVERLVYKLLEFIKENNLGGFTVSSASLSFNAFRHRFMKRDIYVHRHPKAIELEVASYRGGRNECFRIGNLSSGKFYLLDVNSMYPHVMKSNRFPTKLVKVEENPTLSGLLNALTRFLVIADVEVEVWEPVIGVKRDKLIFPIGRFRACLTTPELLMVLQHGEIKKVYAYAIYEHDYIFKDYVEFFHLLKQKYESEGNKPFREFSKLMLNSLYGKFGQRVRRFIKIMEGAEEPNHIEIMIDAETGAKSLLLYLNGDVYLLEKAELSENSFPAVASFTTAYARCFLTRLIQKAGWNNVIYCDTDSLLVNEEGYARLKHLVKGSELGLLKLEGVYDNVEVIACKHYRLGERVIKLKGIKKNARKVGESKFVQSQFLKTKTMLHKCLDGAVYEKLVEKNLSLTYDKGVIGEDGRVYPYYLLAS